MRPGLPRRSPRSRQDDAYDKRTGQSCLAPAGKRALGAMARWSRAPTACRLARVFLAGRTALVTGGARGIGRAVAEQLMREGARVIVTGRTEDVVRAAAEIGAEALELDVADRVSVEACIARLGERRVDV